MTETSPFVPGARVAHQRWRDDVWNERFIDKVYKSGRFTLKDGSGQQWRPHSWMNRDNRLVWTAHPTGDHYNRAFVKAWTPETDKEISEAIATTKRLARWMKLRSIFERVKLNNLTDEMLDQVEAAINGNAPCT